MTDMTDTTDTIDTTDTLDYFESIEEGKIGEQIFIEDYFEKRNIEYHDVRIGIPSYQKDDIDFKEKKSNKTWEIKCNYKDDEQIYIETMHNTDETLGEIKVGWIETCKADEIVFVCEKNRTMIFIEVKKLKEKYEEIKDNYPEIPNKVTEKNNGRKNKSSFKVIPLTEFSGLYRKETFLDDVYCLSRKTQLSLVAGM